MKIFALLLFFPALAIHPQTAANPQPTVIPSSTNAATILEIARNQNGLDGKDLQPWHLKAHYETFGPKGAPTGNGIFEEWWVAPDRYKRSYTSPQFTQSEYHTPDELFTSGASGSTPWPESLIGDHVLAPLPSADEIAESSPEKRRQSFGKVTLECVMLSQKIARMGPPPLGLFPTYCFSPDNPTLRYSNYYGSVQSIFNRIGLFQGRYLGLDTTIKDRADDLLHLQVDSLTGLPNAIADVSPPPDAVKHVTQKTDVGAGVMAGSRVMGGNPYYPARAKQNRISGKVELQATIGKDGHIYHLLVLKAPDPDLAFAAIAAVEQWVYKPYLLNGDPVDVKTTITVNFTLGGG